MTEAQRLIAALGLERHPEGGWYRQTWIDDSSPGRPGGTAIHFLLQAGERSHWHRVDAVEIWHWHAGAPLILSLAETAEGPARDIRLGPDVLAGEAPQVIVPAHHWQAAAPTGDWGLVSCTVTPGFRFEGFTLAAPGFDIPRG
ncbi:cupin domain-containing protein [Gemmobacter lutimaris]|uniref:Cupin domain-containing protein n=1 Tax=Gemmobacter lutimaris TaxID=2306023 RepID=A0A398BLN7_9RHOB|nr:cupin domain-containing protein [Gemmobacter lutimaris]RID91425.1 cupin domain-containing protein [Gemmobacter lutimaris]